MDTYELFMAEALQLAQRAEGRTSPNPMVGAVVVQAGKIVGRGYHRQAGGAHAEIEALQEAGEAAYGATMFVTLEPCNHHGRTPPCTEAIIQAGITSLFYATNDPNPQVSGRGHACLQQAGITVRQGPCKEAAQHLNRFFFHHITTKRPYIIAKFAVSLDGKIATRTGHSQWITGTEGRLESHKLRNKCDAILVGAGTVIADDPQLTTRLPEQADVRHPLRVVLDTRGRVPLTARLFYPNLPGKTMIATSQNISKSTRNTLQRRGVEVVMLPLNQTNKVDIAPLLNYLGQHNVISLIVEGGGEVLGSFFDEKLVNEVWAFLSPLIIGGQQAPGPVKGQGAERLTEALRLQNVTIQTLGNDFLMRGIITY